MIQLLKGKHLEEIRIYLLKRFSLSWIGLVHDFQGYAIHAYLLPVFRLDLILHILYRLNLLVVDAMVVCRLFLHHGFR